MFDPNRVEVRFRAFPIQVAMLALMAFVAATLYVNPMHAALGVYQPYSLSQGVNLILTGLFASAMVGWLALFALIPVSPHVKIRAIAMILYTGLVWGFPAGALTAMGAVLIIGLWSRRIGYDSPFYQRLEEEGPYISY